MTMSLGNKLTIYLLLGVLMVTGLDVYLSLTLTRAYLLSDLRREVAVISRTLRTMVEMATQKGAVPDFAQLADEISQYENVLGVAFYNHDGQMIFTSAALQERLLPEVDVRSIVATPRTIEGTFAEDGAQRYYRIEPIISPNEAQVAAFLILEDFPPFTREAYSRTLQILLGSLVLLVVLSVIVSQLVRHNISRPLRLVIRRVKAIGQGQLDQRLQLRQRDEIGQLADEFDNMCARLEASQQHLLVSHEENLRLERALRHSEKLAVLGQLAARLAHEIGTPLNVIQMRAEDLLERETQSAQDRTVLNVIIAQIERISGFIRQLLTLARRPELQFQIVHLNEVVRRVREIVGERGHTPGVEITVDLAPDLPPIRADADQLQQVMLNLIVNALHAVGTAGRVTLSTRLVPNRGRQGTGTLEAIITDTGPGIPADDLPRIFEPFFTTKGTSGGTGLGLAISRDIVLSHRGEIHVESEPGRGSRFVVALPPAADRITHEAILAHE